MKTLKTLAISFLISMVAVTTAMAININTATKEQLMSELYRVGPVTSERIINERENGPFKDEMDLQSRVMGLGPRIIEQNSDKIQFTDEAAAAAEGAMVQDPDTGETMATGENTSQ